MVVTLIETQVIFGIPIDATQSGNYVVNIIAGLFLLALFITLKNIFQTIIEKRYLIMAIKNFRKAESKNNTEEVVRLTREGLPNCIIRKRIDLLHKIRQLQSISTDLIARLDTLEEMHNYHFVRFVTSMLLVLGLMGTVIGLTLSVQGIMPAIKQTQQLSDISILTKAMAETMNGLRTAFTATLAGLAGTFVLSTMVMLAQRFEATFHHKLESFLGCDLIPKILISTEQESATLYVEAIRNSAEEVAKAADILDRSREGIQMIVDGLLQVTRVSETRIVDFFNFAQSFRDSVSQLIGYNDDLKTVYKNIQDTFREMKENQVTSKLIGEIVDKSVVRALSEANESVQITRQAFKGDLMEIMKSQQEYVGAVNRTSEAINSFSKESAESIAQVVNKSLQEALYNFKQGLQQAQEREDVSRMVAGEALEQSRSYVEHSMQCIEQLKSYIQDASHYQQQSRIAIEKLIAQSNELQPQATKQLNFMGNQSSTFPKKMTISETKEEKGGMHVE